MADPAHAITLLKHKGNSEEQMRRPLAAFTLVAVLGVSPAVADPPVQEPALKRLVDRVTGLSGRVGVAVVDLDSGELVMGNDADVPFNPASNMKIVTAWAALRRLGPQHRYLTGLYGRIDGDRVGRLAIRGDGDPSLDHHHLWEMAARLHRAGVRRVGEIVVDQSAFDDEFTPPAFAQQPNEWASFRSPVAAVSVARNTVTFEIRTRAVGERADVKVVPKRFVEMSGGVSTAAPGATDKLRVTLVPFEGRLKATLGGEVPQSPTTRYLVRRVEDPRTLPGHALADVLEQVGITLEGSVDVGEKRGKLLSAHRSTPLASLLLRLGKNSDNFYAEMIFKSLSAGDEPASFARSSTLVRKMLGEAGIDVGRLRFDNGSGLFDANRLTPLATAQLLRLAYHDPQLGPELIAQLSIGGTDGTLRARLRKLKGSGRFRAKTGTLNAVSALSGVVLGKKRRYAVSILLNDVGGSSVRLRRDMDRFVESLL